MSATEARHAMKLRLGTDFRARKPDAIIRTYDIELIYKELENERLWGCIFVWAVTALGLAFIPSWYVIALAIVATVIAWLVFRNTRRVAYRKMLLILLSHWRIR